MKKTIGDIFLKHSLTNWGVCEFESVLPLIDCRAKSRLPKTPKSIIVCLFPYYVGEYEKNLSRYAIIPDYHTIALEILNDISNNLKSLYPENSFVPFVDSSPIREVAAAYNAGLGKIGENGLLINYDYGSFVFIGEIVTDLILTPDSPVNESCLNCKKCEKSCPGGAIKNGKVDKEKCLSHITQKKGELTPWETSLVKSGGLVWGCDVCSDVCPLNQNPKLTPIKAFFNNIIPCYDGDFSPERAYAWRPKSVIERNLLIIKEKHNGISK